MRGLFFFITRIRVRFRGRMAHLKNERWGSLLLFLRRHRRVMIKHGVLVDLEFSIYICNESFMFGRCVSLAFVCVSLLKFWSFVYVMRVMLFLFTPFAILWGRRINLLHFLGVEDGFSFDFGQWRFCNPVAHCIYVGDSGLRCLGFSISHSTLYIGILYSKELVNGIFSWGGVFDKSFYSVVPV